MRQKASDSFPRVFQHEAIHLGGRKQCNHVKHFVNYFMLKSGTGGALVSMGNLFLDPLSQTPKNHG